MNNFKYLTEKARIEQKFLLFENKTDIGLMCHSKPGFVEKY